MDSVLSSYDNFAADDRRNWFELAVHVSTIMGFHIDSWGKHYFVVVMWFWSGLCNISLKPNELIFYRNQREINDTIFIWKQFFDQWKNVYTINV